MRYNHIILSFLLLLSTTLFAKSGESKRYYNTSRWAVAPLIGSDLGAALPVPVTAAGDKMNAAPRVNLSLGLSTIAHADEDWGLGFDIIYKTVELNAKVMVENQRAQLGSTVQYFTGIAKSTMRFTSVEFPLYLTYTIPHTKHSFMFGGYGSSVIDATFINDPQKGYIGSLPNVVDAPITAPSETTKMDFSPFLRRWDAGLVTGYSNEIIPRLSVGIRFSVGLCDIFKGDSKVLDYNMLQMKGSLVVSYILFSLKDKK